MEDYHNLFNNILDVFAEAEDVRKKGIMPGLLEKHKQFMCSQIVPRKEVNHIQKMFHHIGRNYESEALKFLNLSPAEVYAYNHYLKNMIERMAIEMIRQGVVVLEVTDSHYDIPSSELTLTFCAINPRPTVKRIDIQRREED